MKTDLEEKMKAYMEQINMRIGRKPINDKHQKFIYYLVSIFILTNDDNVKRPFIFSFLCIRDLCDFFFLQITSQFILLFALYFCAVCTFAIRYEAHVMSK